MPNIEHFATGGTIDSVWVPEKDTAQVADYSVTGEYLRFLGQYGFDLIPSTTLLLKDSREISVPMQDQMAASLAESSAKRLLVTSGTYLMPDIARSLSSHVMAQHFPSYGKRVVFTGSLTPIKGFEMSDGGFNLGMAVALLQQERIPGDPTILATMNGNAVPDTSLRKDLTTATFSGRTEADDVLGYRNLTLIPAGGTIDFEEDGLDGLQPAADSAIPTYLRDRVRLTKKVEAGAPILKDSRQLTTEDISTVVDMIRNSTDEYTLVTAGLIKIGDLRAKIQEALTGEDRDRRIVLTGSRFKLRGSSMTDATFNLGYALGALGNVEPGAHIALAGRMIPDEENPLPYVYKPGEVEKVRN